MAAKDKPPARRTGTAYEADTVGKKPISSKPDTCTDTVNVYAAGTSGKAARIT